MYIIIEWGKSAIWIFSFCLTPIEQLVCSFIIDLVRRYQLQLFSYCVVLWNAYTGIIWLHIFISIQQQHLYEHGEWLYH